MGTSLTPISLLCIWKHSPSSSRGQIKTSKLLLWCQNQSRISYCLPRCVSRMHTYITYLFTRAFSPALHLIYNIAHGDPELCDSCLVYSPERRRYKRSVWCVLIDVQRGIWFGFQKRLDTLTRQWAVVWTIDSRNIRHCIWRDWASIYTHVHSLLVLYFTFSRYWRREESRLWMRLVAWPRKRA